jgi:hypothetical protein
VSTFLYNKAKSDFATAALNWPACTPKAMLVTAAYTPSTAHQFVTDIPAGAIGVRDLAMSGVAQANGLCSGTVAQANALLVTDPIVGLIIYASTGVDSTSRLIYYSSDGLGFPFQAVGFNYAIAFDQSYAGWFQV